MSVLSTITVTLHDEDAETTFVEAFLKALEQTKGFPGLEQLIAARVLGQERTYHLHTEWATEEEMVSWQRHPGYRLVRDAFDVRLVAEIDIKRWVSS
jgi:heme-degrading monooxygenase HmoA